MAVSPYMLNQALASLSSTVLAALYQLPSRAGSSVAGATTGIVTMTTPTAFPVTAGAAITLTSASLPAVFTGVSPVYIRPVPSTTGQFYCYATLSNALTDTARLVPASSFTGTATDLDLDLQYHLPALLAYELSGSGYTRTTADYATGPVGQAASIVRQVLYPLSNNTATATNVTHVVAFQSTNLIALSKLPSAGVVPANGSLVVATSFTSASL